MKFYNYLLSFFSVLMIFSGCKEDKLISPLNQEGAVPGPVSNVRVENLHGGARFTYSMPTDEDLLYVKAVFNIREGYTREVRASYYTNSLTIDGFPTTDEYQVKLYAVSRSEKVSEPVTVSIHPLTPPVQEIFETLNISGTFGGIHLTFQNTEAASVAVTVLTPNELGELAPVETFYTKTVNGSFYSRGFEPAERTFGVFVRDRWGNLSDTVKVVLTPLYEQLLDRTKLRALQLPGDNYVPQASQWGMEKMWNGISNDHEDIFQTMVGSGMPSTFTIDLGITAEISRYKLFHRAGENIYSGAAPKLWEVYGSNNPDSDGGWLNWVLLMECVSFKPSALPVGTYTTEDVQYGIVNGEDFVFPENVPAVRYLRFKMVQTWGRTDFFHISELKFWGKPAN